MGLTFEGIEQSFGAHAVLRDFSLAIEPGEIVCLLGPSGCGKTTLLRIAAGLERPSAGIVSVAGRVVSDDARHVPPELRNVGLMFQDYALFPHLNVADNVAFGLVHLDASERRARVAKILAQVGMADRAQAFPHTLSGGQQQRVALARALAPRPAVMLLDEPFSGLDQATRAQVREQTVQILKETGVSALLVTHHPEEGMFVADRMVVMGPTGRILQQGTPHEVYSAPAHPFVASFFGRVNEIEGVAQSGLIETPLGPVAAPGLPDGMRALVVFRVYSVELAPLANGARAVEILSARPFGRHTFIQFRPKGAGEGEVFRCRHRGIFAPAPGVEIGARIVPGEAFVYRMDDFPEA